MQHELHESSVRCESCDMMSCDPGCKRQQADNSFEFCIQLLMRGCFHPHVHFLPCHALNSLTAAAAETLLPEVFLHLLLLAVNHA